MCYFSLSTSKSLKIYECLFIPDCARKIIWLLVNNSGAPAASRVAKRSPIHIWKTKRNPWIDFLMVIMVSGISRGCERMTAATATESRKMVAILQIRGWQRHTALVYHWTSMLRSIDTYQNKVFADQYHVAISRAQVHNSLRSRVFWSWPLTKRRFMVGSRA